MGEPTGPVKWPVFQRVVDALIDTLRATSVEVKALQERVAQLEAAPPLTAQEHAKGVEYEAGAYAVSRGKLYKCQRKTTEPPSNSEYWQPVAAITVRMGADQ